MKRVLAFLLIINTGIPAAHAELNRWHAAATATALGSIINLGETFAKKKKSYSKTVKLIRTLASVIGVGATIALLARAHKTETARIEAAERARVEEIQGFWADEKDKKRKGREGLIQAQEEAAAQAAQRAEAERAAAETARQQAVKRQAEEELVRRSISQALYQQKESAKAELLAIANSLHRESDALTNRIQTLPNETAKTALTTRLNQSISEISRNMGNLLTTLSAHTTDVDSSTAGQARIKELGQRRIEALAKAEELRAAAQKIIAELEQEVAKQTAAEIAREEEAARKRAEEAAVVAAMWREALTAEKKDALAELSGMQLKLAQPFIALNNRIKTLPDEAQKTALLERFEKCRDEIIGKINDLRQELTLADINSEQSFQATRATANTNIARLQQRAQEVIEGTEREVAAIEAARREEAARRAAVAPEPASARAEELPEEKRSSAVARLEAMHDALNQAYAQLEERIRAERPNLESNLKLAKAEIDKVVGVRTALANTDLDGDLDEAISVRSGKAEAFAKKAEEIMATTRRAIAATAPTAATNAAGGAGAEEPEDRLTSDIAAASFACVPEAQRMPVVRPAASSSFVRAESPDELKASLFIPDNKALLSTVPVLETVDVWQPVKSIVGYAGHHAPQHTCVVTPLGTGWTGSVTNIKLRNEPLFNAEGLPIDRTGRVLGDDEEPTLLPGWARYEDSYVMQEAGGSMQFNVNDGSGRPVHRAQDGLLFAETAQYDATIAACMQASGKKGTITTETVKTINNQLKIDQPLGGSSALHVCTINGNTLDILNCDDSGSLLFYSDGTTAPTPKDQETGTYMSLHPFFTNNPNSRALVREGHLNRLGNDEGNRPLCVEHGTSEISPRAKYLIVACDGFWDIFLNKAKTQPSGITPQQAYTLIDHAIAKNQNPGQALAQWAREHGRSTDDITVLVFAFGYKPKNRAASVLDEPEYILSEPYQSLVNQQASLRTAAAARAASE